MKNTDLKKQDTKHKIIVAFFQLLEKKHFSEITVTEIVKEAGVARATYYRNFDIKEDIVDAYMEELHQALSFFPVAQDFSQPKFSFENLTARLEYIASQKKYIFLLCKNGFSAFLQDETNWFAEVILGDMPNHSVERYNIYLISGAMLNLILQWVKNDCKESPEEIAYLILRWFSIMFPKFY